MADGPIIQEAAHCSLSENVRIKDAFDMVKDARTSGVTIPILFFSYYNIIYAMGIKKFVQSLKRSGFDGVVCPDLPIEEDEGLLALLEDSGLSFITLIAPTTTPERMKKLASQSRGFIYYVSRRGVTGVQQSLDTAIAKNVKAIKRYTTRDVLVGFGVSTAAHVRTIASASDGVIVGSAIVDTIKKTKSVKKTLAFINSLARGCLLSKE
jgi:tryptophan synthase alpha chain